MMLQKIENQQSAIDFLIENEIIDINNNNLCVIDDIRCRCDSQILVDIIKCSGSKILKANDWKIVFLPPFQIYYDVYNKIL